MLAPGSAGWGGTGRPFWTDTGNSPGAAGRPGQAEDFYGLGDFFRDLDKELSGLEASLRRRNMTDGQTLLTRTHVAALFHPQKRASSRSGSSGEYASLLDELAAIGMSLGEELVEFLEGGITPQSGSATSSTTRGTNSARDPPRAGSSSGVGGDARRSSSAPTPNARSLPPKGPPTSPPPASQSVDDMLQQLKKEMGLL